MWCELGNIVVRATDLLALRVAIYDERTRPLRRV